MLKLLHLTFLPTASAAPKSARWKFLMRELSTLTTKRCSHFQREFRLRSQRRPVATPRTNKSLRPDLHPDQIAIRPARDLWKALAFTIGVGTATYTIAAVTEFERIKRLRHKTKDFFTDFSFKDVFSQIADKNQQRIPKLTDGEKATYSIIAINFLISSIWRIPRLQPAMYKYFTNSFASKSLCAPMLLSVFSHNNFIHLAANMYVLYSFAPPCINQFLGIDQFIALYLTAGALSSFTSLIHKSAIKSNIRALGASGAICALLTYTCKKIPDTQLSIIFLPSFQFSAEHAIYGLVAFDVLGLIFRFRLFDHAAHLGGAFLGIFYAMYGENWIRHYFNPFIHKALHNSEKNR